MSENTVDLSTKFSPEEWNLIESGPFLDGLSVALSDLRKGLFGAIKESFVPFEAIMGPGSAASNQVVASVVAGFKEMAAKHERLQSPVSVGGKKPEEVKAEVAAQVAKIPAILEGKVPRTRPRDTRNGSWILL